MLSDTAKRRIGWGMSVLLALFMIGASAMPKLLHLAMVDQIMAGLGYPEAPILLIGVMEVGFVLLFLFPPTAVLGGILMMGLLGGALVTNLRADQPMFSTTLFGVYLGIWMWVALWLRDPAFRAVFPFKR